MNALDRLNAAHAAAAAGRHDDALREHLWFHANALAENPALGAVRLSFALDLWKDLGDVHPPAMAALLDARDRLVSTLAAGADDWQRFHELTALNRTLDDARNTCDVFQRLHRDSPAFAARCARLALPSLVACGEFELARRVMDDPGADMQQRVDRLNQNIVFATARPTSEEQAAAREAYVQLTADGLMLTVLVLRETNEAALAATLLSDALRGIDDPDVRAAVSRLLDSA